jgi:hypothetical protein
MSYHATISFKTLKPNEMYAFFQKLKDRVHSNLAAIAEDEYFYMPSFRYTHLYEGCKYVIKEDADTAWAKGVFTMRFFYLAEHDLIGVFGVTDSVQDIFDDTIYFQNSCDQDYDFETWAKVPHFSAIADKWANTSDEEIRKKYNSDRYGEMDEDEPIDCDYYRRTFAYDEIWEICEGYLWHEEQVVYLSMFGFYDFEPLNKFIKLCKGKVKEAFPYRTEGL